jgi:hypothetical protein
MAEQEGLSVVAVRIGAFQPLEAAREEANLSMIDAFVSPRDLTQLLTRAIDMDGLRWAVVHGLSNNRFKRLDISDARVLLGYKPQDDLAAENALLASTGLSDEKPGHNLTDPSERSGLRKDL